MLENSEVYFVTGAAGFVGRNVCKLLKQSGFEVRAMIRREDAELMQIGVNLKIGDLWDHDLLKDVISDADIVIHCAGDAHFGNGSHYHRANVELTEHIINTAKLYSNNPRFVYISTIGAIDRANNDKCLAPLTEETPPFPTSDYGRSKLRSEEVVKRSGLPFSIIRPTMVVGGDMRSDSHFSVFAQYSLAGSLVAKIGWTGEFSVVHVDDLARGILVLATSPDAVNEIFFCAGESISIADFFLQCSPEKTYIPLSLFPDALRYFIKWIPFSLKAMLFPALTASDRKIRALGWSPSYSVQSALAEVINSRLKQSTYSVAGTVHISISNHSRSLANELKVITLKNLDDVIKKHNVIVLDKNNMQSNLDSIGLKDYDYINMILDNGYKMYGEYDRNTLYVHDVL
jgi:nucleoside-diphosphate-sugar epimerase